MDTQVRAAFRLHRFPCCTATIVCKRRCDMAGVVRFERKVVSGGIHGTLEIVSV